MKNVYVLGNWKSNKTVDEATTWVQTFKQYAKEIPKNTTVIVCPGFHHLQLFDNNIFPVTVGVQNVSAFPVGAYTGEIAAVTLIGLVEYVLLGHSERRNMLAETDEIIVQKVKQALVSGLKPIVCVSNLEQVESLHTKIPDFGSNGLILYEPLSAIGTGKADDPQTANTMASSIIEILGVLPILYGGSVVPENVAGFTSQECIAGVGVGGASLDVNTFMKVIQSASQT